MEKSNAPLFRKAGRGYNKDDVNKYILSLSQSFEEMRVAYDSLLSTLEEKDRENATLSEKINSLNAENASLTEKASDTAELEKLREENASLSAQLEKAVADKESVTASYELVCSKAGRILAIASQTADDILGRANGEAHKIIDDANETKDNMFRSVSAVAGDFSTDVEAYIKGAADNCLERINAEIASVCGTSKTDTHIRFLDDIN